MKIGFPSDKNIHYDWVSLLRSYKKYVKKSSLVLEIGASSPERTKDLAKCCHNLIGVELLAERKPADFNNVHYITGDWQNLSKFIKITNIDLAVSSNTIEHVSDDLRALNELHKVLKPGGVALINTPNRKRLTQSLLSKFKGETVFPYGEHIREYTENDLINLIKRSNFRRYIIKPVVFGIHAGSLYLYLEKPPSQFRKLANFWEIHLFKDTN